MSNKAIVVRGSDTTGFQVGIDSASKRLREELLAKAAKVINVKIINTATQATATRMAGELKGILQAIEDDRAAVKKPFWDTGQTIDRIAKELKEPVQTAIALIEQDLARYQRGLEAEAQRQRQEQERQRIEAETRAAQAQAALEAAQRAQQDTTQAEIDAAMASEEAQEVAETVHVEVEVPKVRGASVKTGYNFVVTDIEALYAWDKKRREEAAKKNRTLPSFIKLTVAQGDFKQYINMLDDQGRAEIPGVEFSEQTTVATRAITPALSIQ